MTARLPLPPLPAPPVIPSVVALAEQVASIEERLDAVMADVAALNRDLRLLGVALRGQADE